jgi:hypothetical protein
MQFRQGLHVVQLRAVDPGYFLVRAWAVDGVRRPSLGNYVI